MGTRGPRYQRPAVRRTSGVLPRALRVPLPRRRHILDGQRQVEMHEAALLPAAEEDDGLP